MSSSRARRAYLVCLAICLAVVAIDQVVKSWSVSQLAGGQVVDLPFGVRLALHRNFGVAFSRLTGFEAILVPVLAVTVLISWTAWTELRRPGASRWAILAYGLVLGGAFGNVIDRMFRGEKFGRGGVVDMIDVGWWPVFNVADAALSVGVVLVVVTLLTQPKRNVPVPHTHAEAKDSTA